MLSSLRIFVGFLFLLLSCVGVCCGFSEVLLVICFWVVRVSSVALKRFVVVLFLLGSGNCSAVSSVV